MTDCVSPLPVRPHVFSNGNLLVLEDLIGTSAKAVIAFLFFLNVVAVCMGYVGIDKLERYGHGPFHGHDGAMHTFFYMFSPVSDRTILFWHSYWGSLLIWAGAISLPLLAIAILFRWERPFLGMVLLFLAFLPFGFTGFLIWLHAYVDLPHAW